MGNLFFGLKAACAKRDAAPYDDLRVASGYAEQGLSSTSLALILIAFAFHGACDHLCAFWKKARIACFGRKRIFATADLLAEFIYFRSWRKLPMMIASPSQRPIAKKLTPPQPTPPANTQSVIQNLHQLDSR